MDATTTNPRQHSLRKTFVLSTASLLLVWITTFFGGVTFVYPLVLVGMLAHFFETARWKSTTLFLLLTPFPVFFLFGVGEYATGNAKLRFRGHPTMETFNLHRELRCGQSPMGCLANGDEWTTFFPMNLGVRTMISTFGYLPNTYTGPYPEKEEAITALRTSFAVTEEELSEDLIRVDNTDYHMDKGVGKAMLKRFRPHQSTPNSRLNITAALWQEECLIVRIPLSDTPSTSSDEGATMALLSKKVGRPFAYYLVNGVDPGDDIPPVMWREEDEITIK